jgi:GcrA cell cycle regulator
METVNWNVENRTQRLEVLYRDGLSFALIAADIGVSRNAAIGKAHRMNLPKREKIVEVKPGRRRSACASSRQQRRDSVRSAAVADRPPPMIIPGHDYRCTIYDLADRSCRYPLWHTRVAHPDRLYCGVPDASFSVGIPYCRHHAMLCETPPR